MIAGSSEAPVRWSTTVLLLLALSGCERVRAALHAFTSPTSAEAPPPPPPPLDAGASNVAAGQLDPGDPTTVPAEPAAAAKPTGAPRVSGAASSETAARTAPDEEHNVTVGGDKGVVVGEKQDVEGVRVGGDKGVLVGKDESTTGVRVGGEKGVVVGKDGDTKGVRIGGDKGVELGKGGLSIGGKTVIGKGKDKK